MGEFWVCLAVTQWGTGLKLIFWQELRETASRGQTELETIFEKKLTHIYIPLYKLSEVLRGLVL